ncbi:ribbon-helix-helix protein, CopG family [Yersinia kristensenii]|uniref:ribbon-helix-helix protein, CopG family n=1 Tax=Yersinia kristensenii TaxID=28152 RepID=UPI001C60FFF0|nr:ribbon-helix-helix protein, CopG family [Yersinia kristensenii]MBW5826550.1 ribbon-helix-helix protein, CopG family [Yersinia kristensenii]
MAKSISEIQQKSDDKRGVRAKGYKLPVSTIALIEGLAKDTGMAQSAVITKAIEMFSESLKK